MRISIQKRLVAQIMNCSPDRVKFDKENLDEIQRDEDARDDMIIRDTID